MLSRLPKSIHLIIYLYLSFDHRHTTLDYREIFNTFQIIIIPIFEWQRIKTILIYTPINIKIISIDGRDFSTRTLGSKTLV